MPRPRTTYAAEYRPAAVKMITEQKPSVAEVARRLGVSGAPLRAWRKAAPAKGDGAFPGHGTPTPPGTSCAGCGPRSPGSRPSGTC